MNGVLTASGEAPVPNPSDPDTTTPTPVTAAPPPTPPPLSKRAERFLYSVTTMGDHPMVALGQVLHAEGLKKPEQQATAMGLNKSTVAAMLKGTGKPQTVTLKEIAYFIGITLEQLSGLFPSASSASAQDPSEEDEAFALSVFQRMAKRKKKKEA